MKEIPPTLSVPRSALQRTIKHGTPKQNHQDRKKERDREKGDFVQLLSRECLICWQLVNNMITSFSRHSQKTVSRQKR